MCNRCAELEDELAAAKRALGEVGSVGDLAAVRTWLGVSKGQARIILRLYRAKARWLPIWLLAEELLNPDGDITAVKAQVFKIRKVLGAEAVETMEGSGYRLAPATLVRVRDALAAGA